MTRFTVDVTTSLAFGDDLDTINGQGGELRAQLALLFPRINARLLAPLPYWRVFKLPADRALDRALASIREYVSRLVDDARIRMEGKDPDAATTFLESLVAAPTGSERPLTDEEVFGNVLTMLVAGEDTTAHTLSWATHLLSERPDVVERIAREAERELGGPIASKTADYGRLQLTAAVASEALRLHAVAPVLSLQATRDVEIENVAIPQGQTINLLTTQPGLRASNFAEPERFDPDRWLGKPAGPQRPESVFPFGHGPRHCPGRSLAMIEISAVLAMLCTRFELSKVPDHPPVTEQFGFVMAPSPIHVMLRHRGASGPS